jgi:PEP-CTERM motif
MKQIVPALAIALIATIGASSASQAAVKVIDFSVSTSNSSTLSYTGATLDKSSAFSFDGTTLAVSSVGADDTGSGLTQGDLITLDPTEIVYGSMTGAVDKPIMNGPIKKTWSDSFGSFTELLDTVVSINRGTMNAITVQLSGTVMGPGFDDTPITFTLTANQNAGPPHGAITAGFTESAVTTGVPEPSTWVMMGLGFVGLGYAAVRRGSKGRSAAAMI